MTSNDGNGLLFPTSVWGLHFRWLSGVCYCHTCTSYRLYFLEYFQRIIRAALSGRVLFSCYVNFRHSLKYRFISPTKMCAFVAIGPPPKCVHLLSISNFMKLILIICPWTVHTCRYLISNVRFSISVVASTHRANWPDIFSFYGTFFSSTIVWLFLSFHTFKFLWGQLFSFVLSVAPQYYLYTSIRYFLLLQCNPCNCSGQIQKYSVTIKAQCSVNRFLVLVSIFFPYLICYFIIHSPCRSPDIAWVLSGQFCAQHQHLKYSIFSCHLIPFSLSLWNQSIVYFP